MPMIILKYLCLIIVISSCHKTDPGSVLTTSTNKDSTNKPKPTAPDYRDSFTGKYKCLLLGTRIASDSNGHYFTYTTRSIDTVSFSKSEQNNIIFTSKTDTFTAMVNKTGYFTNNPGNINLTQRIGNFYTLKDSMAMREKRGGPW
jgi:hypothetical protein